MRKALLALLLLMVVFTGCDEKWYEGTVVDVYYHDPSNCYKVKISTDRWDTVVCVEEKYSKQIDSIITGSNVKVLVDEEYEVCIEIVMGSYHWCHVSGALVKPFKRRTFTTMESAI